MAALLAAMVVATVKVATVVETEKKPLSKRKQPLASFLAKNSTTSSTLVSSSTDTGSTASYSRPVIAPRTEDRPQPRVKQVARKAHVSFGPSNTSPGLEARAMNPRPTSSKRKGTAVMVRPPMVGSAATSITTAAVAATAAHSFDGGGQPDQPSVSAAAAGASTSPNQRQARPTPGKDAFINAGSPSSPSPSKQRGRGGQKQHHSSKPVEQYNGSMEWLQPYELGDEASAWPTAVRASASPSHQPHNSTPTSQILEAARTIGDQGLLNNVGGNG